MNPPRTPADAAVFARCDATNVQESNTHGFNLMRLIAADMEREAQANTSDNGMVATWAGMLRWIIDVMDERNDALRDRYFEAGWLNLPGRTGSA